MTTLIKILDTSGIKTSKQFRIDVKKLEHEFQTWALILLVEDINNIKLTIKSIMKNCNFSEKKAKAIAFLANFKGSSIIMVGHKKDISELITKFKTDNINVFGMKI